MAKNTKISAPVPLEEDEQIALFRWAAYESAAIQELKLMYHIPNGGKRNKVVAAKFKRMGVKAGVPDIFLAAPKGGYHGLYIELKRTKGGSTSDNQDDWIDALREQGYRVDVCKGWEKARESILDYLGRTER